MIVKRRIGLVREMVAAGLMLALLLCTSSFGSWRTRAAVQTGPVSAQEDVPGDAPGITPAGKSGVMLGITPYIETGP